MSEQLNGLEVFAANGVAVQSQPVRILLVEDELLISMVTAELLGDAGFLVEEAATATEAVEKLTVRFAAAIVDIGLPDRPGDVLARELREAQADMPILIASGRDRREVARMFKDDDKVGCVSKPYDIDVLLDALRDLGVTAEVEA
jgi:DNA-binding response OmpR family regulator